MNKYRKYFIVIVGLFLANQLYILSRNESLINSLLKSNSTNQVGGHNFLELEEEDLKCNIISINGKKVGIIQFYIGSKVII